nr:hypothetical protein [Tanacetum cinerariifolium]
MHRKHDEIERKNLLITNDNLIADCLEDVGRIHPIHPFLRRRQKESGTAYSGKEKSQSHCDPLSPPPSTSQSDQSKSTVASSSSKIAALAEYISWTTTNIKIKPSVSLILETLHMDDDTAPDKQVHSSDDEDIGNAHIPNMNLKQDWWKPLQEDRPATPEPAWSIPSSDLLYQMEECHKLLTDKVDESIIRYNVSKPLPLGGPPGQVTIQSDFFFNKDLEYIRYSSKGGRPALTILKMKVAYYHDVGLEEMVPDQMWIEEEYKYDIAAMYGISHWWFQRQPFYIDRHSSEGHRRAVRTHMWILSVVRIKVFSMYGSPEPSTTQDKKIITTAVNLWTRNLGIIQCVEDFQLRIESYQTLLNLTKPRWDATCFEYKHDFTLIDSSRSVTFKDKYGVQMIMRKLCWWKSKRGRLQTSAANFVLSNPGERIWEEFTQSIHSFVEDKKNLALHTQGKKKANPIVILSISAKGTKREVFGMPIPNELITADIRDTMADVNVNAPADQAPTMAPPTCTDDQILPHIRWHTNFFKAFTTSSNIPSIYIQQFWDTVRYDKTAGCYKCQLDEQWFDLTKDTLKDALQITPFNNNNAFSSPPSFDALINLVNDLGYPKVVRNLSNVVTNDMFQLWRALTKTINLCLTGKTLGFERPRAPSKHKFHPRLDSPLHLPNEEHVLGYLKFSAKGTKREVFGMPIPNKLITADIQGEPYYKEYPEKGAKHQRYLAGEKGSDHVSPVPKPAKATKKSKPSAPKADLRPPPSPARRSKPGLVTKRRKPTRSLRPIDEPVDEGIPKKEPRFDDEEADVQRALEESLKSVYDAPRGPFPPVVIREPDSEKYQSLPEVQGKGKEKVSDEQVALDLLTLQTPKKKSPTDQYIFQRRTSTPTESSGHDESSSLYAKLGLIDNEVKSDEDVSWIDAGVQDEG